MIQIKLTKTDHIDKGYGTEVGRTQNYVTDNIVYLDLKQKGKRTVKLTNYKNLSLKEK